MSDDILDPPEGVESMMFLRDGWPLAVVCKVKMRDGRVGIGLFRLRDRYGSIAPALADEAALENAMDNLSDEPPDYTEIHEHVLRMKDAAEARAAK